MNCVFLFKKSPLFRISSIFLFPHVHPVTLQGVVTYSDTLYIQLFRGRLSDKVHATTTNGIVGGFEFTVL